MFWSSVQAGFLLLLLLFVFVFLGKGITYFGSQPQRFQVPYGMEGMVGQSLLQLPRKGENTFTSSCFFFPLLLYRAPSLWDGPLHSRQI
jgi:hypothetical protein